MPVTYETLIRVDHGDVCTWHEFLTANNDAIGEAEENEIRAALEAVGEYRGGGGAMAEFVVELAATIGDFVEDYARDNPIKGRIVARDDGRPDAFFVKFTNGSTESVGASYLRVLRKKPRAGRYGRVG